MQPATKKFLRYLLTIFAFLFVASSVLAYDFNLRLRTLASPVVYDRKGEVIAIKANSKGYYSRHVESLPPEFEKLLLQKEDKYFYYHPGANPGSMLRASLRFVASGRPGGSSTLTQQLVKTVLGNEQKRNVGNKLIESAYALSLETWHSKPEILSMYADNVYLGNLAQGFEEGAYVYFGKPLEQLNKIQSQALIDTLTNPAKLKPAKSSTYVHNTPTLFELETASAPCKTDCVSTVDKELTEKIRAELAELVSHQSFRGVTNGVVIVVKEPENEILAMVGSPDPSKVAFGAQINMALEHRPIGSTIKPFIYTRAFEKGLRPYSLIEDREYKYDIGTGFALYPKNYDGKYRGTVTAAEALSNSLNVPAVKTLEFVTLPDFYNLFENKLGFKSLQPLSSYQLGIALGGLEMDPLTLAQYFSIFPNKGVLKPLILSSSASPLALRATEDKLALETPMSKISGETKIFNEPEIELVTRILSDRSLSVDQFGAKSSLDLEQKNYAVKTGTSYDYHDSWTVGWTPDYLVLAWVGNSDNTALNQVSGQEGAGGLWRQTMELLANSEYNLKTPLNFSHIKEIPLNNSITYGLPSDVVSEHENLIKETSLITSPHEGDLFSAQGGSASGGELYNLAIPLQATESVTWFANNKYLGQGQTLTFTPQQVGRYKIEAVSLSGQTESVSIAVTNE